MESDGNPIQMIVDTGAGVSIISEPTFRDAWKHQTPLPVRSSLRLHIMGKQQSKSCKNCADHGLPDSVVTDNGARFTSSKFQCFLK